MEDKANSTTPCACTRQNRSWQDHVSTWRAYSAYYAAHANAEPKDPRSSEHDDWNDANTEIGDRHEAMLMELLREPTPDATAFAEKIAIFKDQFDHSKNVPLSFVLDDAMRQHSPVAFDVSMLDDHSSRLELALTLLSYASGHETGDLLPTAERLIREAKAEFDNRICGDLLQAKRAEGSHA